MQGGVDFFLEIRVQPSEFLRDLFIDFFKYRVNTALWVIHDLVFSTAFPSWCGCASETVGGYHVDLDGFFSTIVEDFSGDEVFDDR